MGNLAHELRKLNFKSAKREIDIGTYYSSNFMGIQVNTFTEIRTSVAALSKKIERRVGIEFLKTF